jgi:hypothetical protein
MMDDGPVEDYGWRGISNGPLFHAEKFTKHNPNFPTYSFMNLRRQSSLRTSRSTCSFQMENN